MNQVTPEPIFQAATTFMAAKHLFAANEIGLFEKLAGGSADLDSLAQRSAVPRRTIRIVADAMVSLGFLEREGILYRNSQVAAAFLAGGERMDLRPFLRFWNRISYPRWTRLEEAVRTGKTPYGEFQFTEEEQKIFSEGVEAVTAGTALALAKSYDFARHRRVLDVGGGTGSFLIPILQQHPAMECTLYELPQVAAVARQRLRGTPFADSIRVVEGDCFKDAIPEGHDAIIVANVAHLLSPERNRGLLKRLRGSVSSGARLLLVDFWTDPTHTQPPFAALMAGEFLLISGEGDVYSTAEVQEWLNDTGWRFVEQVPLAGPSSLIVAEASG